MEYEKNALITLLAVFATAFIPSGCAKDDQSETTSSDASVNFVDLGLPSGTLWADRDLKGTYAWGEIEEQDNWNGWETYRYCNGTNNTLTKYCNNHFVGYNGYTDTLSTLEAMDDVATQILGSGSHIPTEDEWDELYSYTTITDTTWEDSSGFPVFGLLFTGSNGNSIVIRHNAEYWSSSLYRGDPRDALQFHLSPYGSISRIERCSTRPIRPVRSAR